MAEPTTTTRDEFTVEHKSIHIIQNNEAKLDKLFYVKVVYLSRNESKNNFEWLRLEGDEENRRNAKEYIIALTKPAESKVLHFPAEMYDFGNMRFLETIEKQTRAHIEQFGSGSVRIHGTSLSVTLALSILEDKINNFINRRKSLGDMTTTKHHDVLNYSLENGFVCSNNSPQKSFNEYNSKNTHSPHQAKHSMKNYSHNNSNSPQDPMNNLLSLPRSQLQNGKIDPMSQSPSSTNLRYSEMGGAPGNSDKDYAARLIAHHQSSGEMSLEGCVLSAERLVFFTNLAKQIGHVPSDIQEALKMASDDMKPSHFIRLLNNIKEEREIVEKEERENDDQSVSESDESKLPIKYIELLMNDFKEEAGISSIEELKRRNQARQQCLQQHTDYSKKDSPKDFLPQAGWDSTKKKKTKKKPARMPDPPQMPLGNYAENNVSQQHVNSEKTPTLGLGHENGKALIERIASSHQSYKSAVTCSSAFNADESSNVHFRQIMGLPPNPSSNYIYSDKHHSESDHSRTCISNKTDELHARYLSPNTESNHFVSQMDLEKNDVPDNDDLRYIVIDGSNIAMAHGNGKFSCKGIQIAVNYFVDRGHNVMVFVPQHKLCAPGPSNNIFDQDILYQLKETGHLAFTPSRKLQGRLINCYDDRFILSLAEREDGIIVSNDQYRDLMHEKATWKEIVEKRLLMYTFVKDNFMLPEDPMGRDGPMLDEFLSKTAKDGNCTPKKSSRQTYRPQYVPQRQQQQPQPSYQILQRGRPRTRQNSNSYSEPSTRSQEETQNLYRDLKVLFPDRDQEEILRKVLCEYPSERDPSRLSNSCIQIIFGN